MGDILFGGQEEGVHVGVVGLPLLYVLHDVGIVLAGVGVTRRVGACTPLYQIRTSLGAQGDAET